MNCKYYRPWVGTSKGEVTDACVDDEERTIRKCDYTLRHGCWRHPLDNGEAIDNLLANAKKRKI